MNKEFKVIVSRMNLLKAMNLIITSMNNEEAIMPWLMEAVPDCPTEDDYEYIANDKELYTNCCSLFRGLIRDYGKDGFYVIGDNRAY